MQGIQKLYSSFSESYDQVVLKGATTAKEIVDFILFLYANDVKYF